MEQNDLFDTYKRVSFHVGTELQLQIGGVAARLKGYLVGIVQEKALIVEAPFINNIKTKLFEGNKIVVRYLYKGTIYGFESALMGVTFSPIRIIFMEYPKIIESHELRSKKRIECFLPTELIIENIKQKGMILDISETGCRCRIKASEDKKLLPVMTNKEISIILQFPGRADKFVVLGKVKNYQRDLKETKIGILFDKVEEETKKLISEYISDVDFY
jgi:c-di-GMP-binding flagellar brake protein YcgR